LSQKPHVVSGLSAAFAAPVLLVSALRVGILRLFHPTLQRRCHTWASGSLVFPALLLLSSLLPALCSLVDTRGSRLLFVVVSQLLQVVALLQFELLGHGFFSVATL